MRHALAGMLPLLAVYAGLSVAAAPCWLLFGRGAGCVVWLVANLVLVVVGTAAMVPDRNAGDEVG